MYSQFYSHLIIYLLFLKCFHICSHPVESHAFIPNYAVLIDCGSTGSRMFIYTWVENKNNDLSLPKISILEDKDGKQIFKKQSPGLSTFSDNIEHIPNYLKPLLDLASLSIPKNLHKNTPLFVLATAGMRFLQDYEQTLIWQKVRDFVVKNYSFNFKPDMAYTITGTEEGIYGWITVNYLLGRFDSLTTSTAGMIDLGGGSMQIAYQIPKNMYNSHQTIFELDLNPKSDEDSLNFSLYSTTFLGYGINSARNLYRGMLASKIYLDVGSRKSIEIKDPCLPVDELDYITNQDVSDYNEFSKHIFSDNFNDRNITLRGTGDIMLCVQTLKPLMAKTSPCDNSPCSMNGVFQPNLPPSDFYLLSEFWYTSDDIKAPHFIEKSVLINKATNFCQNNWLDLKQKLINYYKDDKEILETELSKKRGRCFNTAWIVLILYEGFGFPEEYNKFFPVLSLNEIEVQWSLGALIFKLYNVFNRPKSVSDGNPIRLVVLILAVLSFLIWFGYNCQLHYSFIDTFGPFLRRNCPARVVDWILAKKRKLSRHKFPSFSRLNGLDDNTIPLHR